MVQMASLSINLSNVNQYSANSIGLDFFGATYTGYRNLSRFDSLSDEAGLMGLRWPGGAAAENSNGWYGLEYPDLVDPNSSKTGLTEVLSYAYNKGKTLTIVIPTAIYATDTNLAQAHFRQLLEDLDSGVYGILPETIIFEVGNEYYALSEFSSNPSAYGNVTNSLLFEYADFDAASFGLLSEVTTKLAVQMGKTPSDNVEIIGAISAMAMAEIDMLTTHRFSWNLEDVDQRTEIVENNVSEWISSGSDPRIELYLSGWNTASWTRQEALDRYIEEYEKHFGLRLDPSGIDVAGRTDAQFENFWQTGELVGPLGQIVQTKFGILDRDYGLSQASVMIETVSEYLAVGVDISTLYGVDNPYPGHVSFGNETFVGGAMLGMMSETLPGKWYVDDGTEDIRPDGETSEFNTWVFTDQSELVIYAVANDFDQSYGNLEFSINFAGLNRVIDHVEVRTLTSTLDENWMEKYSVPDNPWVDETPEARLYEKGAVSDVTEFLNSQSHFSSFFTQDYQVVEIIVVYSDGDFFRGGFESDVLVGTAHRDILEGYDGDDILEGGNGRDDLIGGAGVDTASYSQALSGVIVDLSFSTVNSGDASGDVFESIENLHGSEYSDDLRGDNSNNTLLGASGNDVLHGRGGNDELLGGVGNDTLLGGLGADILDGGLGVDLAGYWSSASGVTADLQYSTNNFGDSAGDQYISIEGLLGTKHADDLRGDEAGNTLIGQGGDDVLHGRGGTDQLFGGDGSDILIGGTCGDRLDGGAGIDRAAYWTSQSGVTADLFFSDNNSGEAKGDLYIDIENLQGTGFDDDLRGNSGANTIWGMHGADVLHGRGGDDFLDGGAGDDILLGGAGADVLVGGEGEDRAAYWSANIGVVANLSNASGNTGDAAGDIYIGVENLQGSNFDDSLSGTNEDNTIWGMDGDDKINGGYGNDQLIGGGGADRFIFNDSFGADTVQDFEDGVDLIDFSQNSHINSLSDLVITQSGSDVLISTDDGGGDYLFLLYQDVDDFDSQDFLF